MQGLKKRKIVWFFTHLFVPLQRYGILSNTWKRNRSGIQPVHNQRPGKLYTTIYYSGRIDHSSTAKELDSQAYITCYQPSSPQPSLLSLTSPSSIHLLSF